MILTSPPTLAALVDAAINSVLRQALKVLRPEVSSDVQMCVFSDASASESEETEGSAKPTTSSSEPWRSSGLTNFKIIGVLPPNFLLGRWRLCLELFGRVFLEDVGAEPSSVLNELGRFDVKEITFRREMDRLKNTSPRDLTLEVRF